MPLRANTLRAASRMRPRLKSLTRARRSSSLALITSLCLHCDVMDVKAFAVGLGEWARAHAGPDASVDGIARLPGHSGISFAFALRSGDGHVERLVIRIPPEGVRRS